MIYNSALVADDNASNPNSKLLELLGQTTYVAYITIETYHCCISVMYLSGNPPPPPRTNTHGDDSRSWSLGTEKNVRKRRHTGLWFQQSVMTHKHEGRTGWG